MQAVGLQTHIWNNNLRSLFLLVGFPFLLIGLICALEIAASVAGLLPSREDGFSLWKLMAASAPAALAVAGVWFVIAYFFNQVIIDIATGAREVDRRDMPELYNLLENLCISRGLRTPSLRIIETDGMNAFASGLHDGRFSVTVTRGLIDNLNKDEVEAVLGHELTHIINRDVRTMVVASVFAGIITLICQMIFRAIYWGAGWGGGRSRDRDGGNMGLFVILAMVIGAIGYFLAIVIQMALSRSREYVADAGSVELTKNPDAMISALMKVSGREHLDAPQSMRAMFLEDNDEGVLGLFVTHPPLAKRIAALQQYAGGRIVEPPPAAPGASVAAGGAPAADEPTGPWARPADDQSKGPWG
ncbi:M48 family metallopeptidase [Caulobacter sp. KR2-114]|uniref:M48 family metallopeptidase n=1 Tax=Caulobacter sp. KR2-114 TaxID=3400912 RepID=UPI003C014FFF